MQHHLEKIWSAPRSYQQTRPYSGRQDAPVADQDDDSDSLESRDAIEHGKRLCSQTSSSRSFVQRALTGLYQCVMASVCFLYKVIVDLVIKCLKNTL